MRVGVQFVRQSGRLRAVLLRVSLFFLHSTALLALLPLVARGLRGGDAGTFTLLLASMGTGAILAALNLSRLRQMMPRDTLVLRSTVLQSLATAVVAFSPNAYVAVPAMFLNGMAWITCANSLSVSAQLSLPDWVRARGMSMYQMAIMGASAAGAAVWGQLATVTSIRTGLLVAAASGTLTMLLAQRRIGELSIEEDLTPSREFKVPANASPGAGHVVVTIEYVIDPARRDDFIVLMQESRRSRLRQGALDWALLRDIAQPGHYLEQITDESWTEHLRRFDRVTASDVALRDRKLAFHVGEDAPAVRRRIVEGARG
jgi:MFS family permease